MGFTEPAFESRTVFVGREVERSQLQRLLELAIRGQGSAVLIAGEAGVGKTRLAEELALEARRRQVSTLIGRCSSSEGAIPYLPFVEILEEMLAHAPSPEAFKEMLGEDGAELVRIAPDLRKVFTHPPARLQLPPEQERRYLFNAIRDAFSRVSQLRPLLMIFDDLQWADSAMLLLLEHLVRHLARSPVLIVAAYRDSEIETGPLAHTIEECVRSRTAQLMTLRRFSAEELRSMLRAIAGQEPPDRLVPLFLAETDGNPFFVEELFKHLAEQGRLHDSQGRLRNDVAIDESEVPGAVRLILSRRLRRLTPTSHEIISAAAVIGRQFSISLLKRVCPAATHESVAGAVGELESAGLVRSAPSSGADFEFSHELVRQTLLGELSLPLRQELHLRIADILSEESAIADRLVPRIAQHYLLAGSIAQPDKALPHLMTAGKAALEALAFEEAVNYFERADSMMAAHDPGRGDMLFRLGLAMRSVGRWETALNTWGRALAWYEDRGELEAAGKVCSAAALLLAWGRQAQALPMAQRGLNLVPSGISAERCRMLACAGGIISFAANPDIGGPMIDEAISIAERLGDESLLGYSLYTKAIHCFSLLLVRETAELAERAAPGLRRARELASLAGNLAFLATAYFYMGKFPELQRVNEELDLVAQRTGNEEPLSVTKSVQSLMEFAVTGNLDELLNSGTKALGPRSERHSGDTATAARLHLMAMAEFWRGDLDNASAHFRESTLFAANPALAPTPSARFDALFLAYAGRKSEALAAVGQWADDVRKLDVLPVASRLALALLAPEVYTIVGEKAQAAGYYPMIVEWMRRGLAYRGHSLRLLETLAAMAAAGGERWDVAQDHYQNALKIAASHPNMVELADIKRFYGQMLLNRDGAGDRNKACDLLHEAIVAYTQIGMPKHREMAETLMKSALSHPKSATADNNSALFRKDAEYWTVAYGGKSIRARDVKGFGYLAHLLANPAREIHVADLVALVSGPVANSGSTRSVAASDRRAPSHRHADAGEMLDREAARQYRTRLSELNTDLEEATERGDSASAEKLQSEIDFITAQLTSAYGLGGRSRKIGDVDERLRKAVRNRIVAAISRIRDKHPVLGEHLAKSIRLGVFCLYLPSEPIEWRL